MLNGQMNPGQVGKITDASHMANEEYIGKHVLKTYENYVLLEKPTKSWTAFDVFQVNVVPEGTSVSIMAG